MIFKERSIPLVFYETINYDFILLSKAGPHQLLYRGSGGKMIVAWRCTKFTKRSGVNCPVAFWLRDLQARLVSVT